MSPERAATLRKELQTALYAGTGLLVLLVVVLVIGWVYSGIKADFTSWRTHQETVSAANRARIEAEARAKCADFKVMERQTCHIKSTSSGNNIFWAEGQLHNPPWWFCIAHLPTSDDDYKIWVKVGTDREIVKWRPGMSDIRAYGFEVKNGEERDITYWHAPTSDGCKT